MGQDVHLVVGPAGSGKTTRLLNMYREQLHNAKPASSLWITPSAASRRFLRERLFAEGIEGCFRPNCLTFNGLAERILTAAPGAQRFLTSVMRRELLRRIITNAVGRGELPFHGAIAHTRGLLEQIAAKVAELKRVEIWPQELQRALGGRAGAKTRELHLLYDRYQQLLNEHQLYDFEGCLWAARERLQKGEAQPFEQLNLLVVSGFSDFTRTQYEILEQLAARAQQTRLSLTHEHQSARPELFARTADTLEVLRRRFPSLVVEELVPETKRPSALRHVERHVFSNPRTAVPAESTSQLEIIEAAGELSELEEIAVRTKRLLAGLESTPPVKAADILVVFRTLAQRVELVREVFARHGIPVWISGSQSLARSPLAAFVVLLLRVHLEDWPYRPLLTLLRHTYFRAESTAVEERFAAQAFIERLQLFSGREQLLIAIRRFVERHEARYAQAEPNSAAQVKAAAQLREAKGALAALEHLKTAYDRLPTRATRSEWAASLTELLSSISCCASSTDKKIEASTNQLVWQQIVQAIGSLDRLAEWEGRQRDQLTTTEFHREVSEILQVEPMASASEWAGCVRVVTAPEARGLQADYVFLAGLAEKSFPIAEGDTTLGSLAEQHRLAQAGLPVLNHAAHASAEMLLFYESITAARKQLIFSYAALDEKAQPLSASPYLDEVQRAFGGAQIRRTVRADLSPVPIASDVTCPRDLRIKAVAKALDGDAGLLTGFVSDRRRKDHAPNLLAGLRMQHERQRREGYGRFEGILWSPKAVESLSSQFGLDHCWSTSQLEQFAYCPFRFFADRVLRVDVNDDPALETDYLLRGRLVHSVLAALHRRLNRKHSKAVSPAECDSDELAAEARQVVESMLSELRSDGPLQSALREVDRRLLMSWLEHYPEQHRQYDASGHGCEGPLRPTYFEVAFGPQHTVDPDDTSLEEIEASLSTIEPFELDCGTLKVRLTGRIDRIDIGWACDRMVFNIVDYKSGRPSKSGAKAVRDGSALQLPLYALAVQEHLLKEQAAIPLVGSYWYLRDKAPQAAVTFHRPQAGRLSPSEDWEELRERLLVLVQSMVHSVRAGQFPMHCSDEDCTGRCEYKSVCRVGQVRALEKQWQPAQPTS